MNDRRRRRKKKEEKKREERENIKIIKERMEKRKGQRI